MAESTQEIKKEERKPHPVFGKWIEVIVHPVNAVDKNTDIFVSVNGFGRQFKPNTAVELPVKIVKFLKESGNVEHYFDEEEVAALSGKRGVHKSRLVKKFHIERVMADEEE